MIGFPGKAEISEERHADVPGEVQDFEQHRMAAWMTAAWCLWDGHRPWWYVPDEEPSHYVDSPNFFTPSVRERILEGAFFVLLVTALIRTIR